MQSLPLIITWTIAGIGLGLAMPWICGFLARWEGLEPGFKSLFQRLGPIVCLSLLFALAAIKSPSWQILLIHTFWAIIFVQIAFFDFEHRLILDKVSLPAMLIAILLSLVPDGPGLIPSLAGGAIAGIFFILVYAIGGALMKEEAMGFGDVKLAILIGLVVGVFFVLRALFLGVVTAGVVSFLLIIFRLKKRRDTFAYGPYLVVGALAVLFQVWGH